MVHKKTVVIVLIVCVMALHLSKSLQAHTGTFVLRCGGGINRHTMVLYSSVADMLIMCLSNWVGSCYWGYVVPSFFAALVPHCGVTVALEEIQRVVRTKEHIGIDTAKALAQLSSELTAVCKMTPKNWLALDILLAEKGGIYAIIGKECCTFIPDTSTNVSSLVTDIHHQVRSLSQGDWTLCSHNGCHLGVDHGFPWLFK